MNPDLRLRQGAILLGGAPLVALAGARSLGAAAVVALAALAGGRRGPLWLAAAALLAAALIPLDAAYWSLAVGLAGAALVLIALSPGRRGGS
jgi:hypothetical protein